MGDEDAKLTDGDVQALQEMAERWRDSKIGRRSVLASIFGVTAGAAGAGGFLSGSASAQADTTDSVGDVGQPADRVDVFADGVDANQLGSSSNRITDIYGDSFDANSVSTDDAVVDSPVTELDTAAGSSSSLNSPHDAEYADGLCFVVGKGDGSSTGTFDILDVSDPSNIQPRISDDTYANCQSVMVDPRPDTPYVYVGDDNGIEARDYANAQNSNVASSVSDTTLQRINGFDIWRNEPDGRVILFAAIKDGYIYAIDITDPTALTIAQSLDVSSTIDSPHDVVLIGDVLYVPNITDGATTKIGTVNVLSRGSWDLKTSSNWTVSSAITDADLNGANRIVRDPNDPHYCYVACNKASSDGNIYGASINGVNASNPAVVDKVSIGATSGLAMHDRTIFLGKGEAITVNDDKTFGSAKTYTTSVSGGHDPALWGRYILLTGQSNDTVATAAFDGGLSDNLGEIR